MGKLVAEYIWIDADGNLRSKAKTLTQSSEIELSTFSKWNFDGSSTGQAVGDDSEVILNPVAFYNDPFRGENSYLVLCDCYDKNMNPIPTNTRRDANIIFNQVYSRHPLYGLEQEYVLYDRKTNRPIGWPKDSYPEHQGKYYCGVGADRAFGREVANKHYKLCLDAGLSISGINGEVMPGQWEFQIGPCEGISAGDQLWVARYILHRVCEMYNVVATLAPKPEKGDWNGSGCHTNFSSLEMREEGGLDKIYEAIEKLSKVHAEHIEVYGSNKERLIGTHETSSIDKFSFGVADRTASIRIPLFVENDGYGYLEDRRPASDCDPYLVTSKIAETILIKN